jgi:glycosyltransferase involved in cell wall biosynthesis
MKIVFLVSHLKGGGAERTVTYLSSYLAKNDFDVTILSLSEEIFYHIDTNVNLVTLNIDSKVKNLLERVLKIIRRKISVSRFIIKQRPDVVFCMLPEMAKYILNLKFKLSFKLITSERNNPEVISSKIQFQIKKIVFKYSDGIIFQTGRAMDFYPNTIKVKSVVIYNAVGNDQVYRIDENVNRTAKISAIGRLVEQKDYPTMLKACMKVFEKHPEYTLEIFGEGPDKNKLKILAEKLNISRGVSFMGLSEDVILQVSNSSCYVLSSIYEGMPNSLLEAMAAGLPCVSTNCPNGPAELITNEVNGLLVPVGDADALADAILRMIENVEFAEKCGKNAKRILDTNNTDVIAKKYKDFILKVCGEK